MTISVEETVDMCIPAAEIPVCLLDAGLWQGALGELLREVVRALPLQPVAVMSGAMLYNIA